LLVGLYNTSDNVTTSPFIQNLTGSYCYSDDA
jgi:hypothetical protein